jgi:hypothetical protein
MSWYFDGRCEQSEATFSSYAGLLRTAHCADARNDAYSSLHQFDCSPRKRASSARALPFCFGSLSRRRFRVRALLGELTRFGFSPRAFFSHFTRFYLLTHTRKPFQRRE